MYLAPGSGAEPGAGIEVGPRKESPSVIGEVCEMGREKIPVIPLLRRRMSPNAVSRWNQKVSFDCMSVIWRKPEI